MLLAMIVAAAAPAPAVTFSYRYPPAAARFAPLKAWLDADRERLRARARRAAERDRAEARASGYPFRPHDAQVEWKVVTQTPRFLSLSAQRYTYTGGAHGGTATSSILWDKVEGRRLAPLDLFLPNALWAAVRRPYCAALLAEQRRRLQQQDVGDTMHACPPLKDLVVLVGSRDGRRLDRIGLVADQYVAGSYAEGIYEITLPVTSAVLGAVKPGYRAAFAVR